MEEASEVYDVVMEKAEEGASAVYDVVMEKAEEGASAVYDVVMEEAEEGAAAVYDVFINHRGKDTKKDVASLVYRRLISYGLRVFLDQKEFEAGDPLYNKIKSAIISSSVHVAIFSVTYAESPWCLNELSDMLDMLESGGKVKVIPVFYDVEPAHLRHIDEKLRRIGEELAVGIENTKYEPYVKAFRYHQKTHRHDAELDRWKAALFKASNISGMPFNKENNDLGDLVDKIVEGVLKEVKWQPLYVAEHPVGLQEAEEHFNNFLKEEQLNGTTVVGIVGLDGSGKSTFVRQVYNGYLKSGKFIRSSFLCELNEKALEFSQQQLLRDLSGDDKHSIKNKYRGMEKLRKYLKRCGPVLIVLDGLEKGEQIKCLLEVVMKDVFAQGSLILVTCHDKGLLTGYKVNIFYDVELLQGKDGHELFCSYAFSQPESPFGPPKPPKDLEELVKKFVEICDGFPFALEVLGRKLYRKDQRYWEAQLKDLSRPESIGKIMDKILKGSYNSLDKKMKEVFLDVAHFLVGEKADLAERVLDGLHGSGGLICLEDLQSKCLLGLEKIEQYRRPFAKGPGIQWRRMGSSKIRMRNLVRKMARGIASEDSCSPLRLCQLDNKSLLQQLQKTGNRVRGIRCEYIDDSQMTYEEINELKLLVLHDFRVTFPFNRLSGDLIWLRMHKSHQGICISPTFSLRNLRVLELAGVGLEALGRMDGDNFPSNLEELTVDYRGELAQIPRTDLPSSSRADKNSMEASSSASFSFWVGPIFRGLTNLVKMVLKNVKGLKSLPIDFEVLGDLRHLDLSGCSDLLMMPDSFSGLLHLEYLALQDCRRLYISDLGRITKLEYLDFEGCLQLKSLPWRTTAQGGLRYLNLMHTSIDSLPEDLGELKNLEQLMIISPRLTILPDSFSQLGQLRILTLSGGGISRFRFSMRCFPYLESFQLLDRRLSTLPHGIAWSSVKVLHVKFPSLPVSLITECASPLRELKWATDRNRVSSLTELKLEGTDISKLWICPEASLFPDLEIVDLSDNLSLTEVQSLPSSLRRLYLMNCKSLTTLPCLSNLACIKILDISGCYNLEALNLEGLRSIEEISAKRCWKLQSIEGLTQLQTLSSLNVSTFTEVSKSTTIWSDILAFPSNVSTVILGGSNVLCMDAEQMDSVKQSILKEFQGTTIIDIPTIENFPQVRQINMELYGGAIMLCFITKRSFLGFELYVGGGVYRVHKPAYVPNKVIPRAFTFMWSQNSDLFKDLRFSGNSVLDITIKGIHNTVKKSFSKAWLVMIENETEGVKICKQLLNSLRCIPQQAVYEAVAS